MTSSAVPRRMLGRELKRLRDQSGVGASAASRALEISPQTLWRMESGQPGPKLKELYVNTLCEMYGATAEVTTALAALVAETKKNRWWQGFHNVVPEHAELLLDLEDVAHRVTTFHVNLIPDLLQTPDYRQAIIRVNAPRSATWQLEQAIEVLGQRQARLQSATSDLEVLALVCESAMHNTVGDAEVMEGQFQHLVTIGRLHNVSVRIVPQHIGVHPGTLTGPFVLLEFPRHQIAHLTEPPLVYVQEYTTSRYLDNKDDVNQYRAAIEEIQRKALDEDTSTQLLHEISGRYHR